MAAVSNVLGSVYEIQLASLESRSAIGKRGRDHRCLLWKTRAKIDLWEKRSNSLKLRTKKKKTHSKRFIFGKSGLLTCRFECDSSICVL